MKYAKLDGTKLVELIRFPNGLTIMNGKFKRNPTDEEILAAGYLPLEETAEPANKDGFIKSSKWVQADTAIVKKWTVKRDMRPLSQSEINNKLIAQQINTLAVDDNTALRMKSFYPTFESIVGQTVKQGFKFTYGGKLWKVAQPELLMQSHYAPSEGMESLYTEVCETYSGTIDDAIPYDGNMELENGKYYTQNGAIYLCNRDTVNPVYNALSELVGLYVVEA